MEVSGKKLRNYCKPCEQRESATYSDGLCSQCEEEMCQQCFDTHVQFRFNRGHTLVNSVEVTSNYEETTMFDNCSRHLNEAIKFFCADHSQVGCGDCMIISHKTCNVDYIFERINEGNDNEDFTRVKEDIEKIDSEAKAMIGSIKRNVDYGKDVKNKFAREVNFFRDELISHVTNLSAEMLKFVDDIMTEDMMRMEKLEKENKSLVDETTKMKDKLQSEANQPYKLFITSMSYKQNLHLIKDQLESIKENDKFETFEFERDYNLEHLVKGCKQLGALKRVKEHETAFGVIKKEIPVYTLPGLGKKEYHLDGNLRQETDKVIRKIDHEIQHLETEMKTTKDNALNRFEETSRDEVSMEYSERQSAGSRVRARHSEPYQSERTGTDEDFERYECKSSASAQRNAPEVLEQKVKSLEKEKERLQHELQAEKSEKDNIFKKLEDGNLETRALKKELNEKHTLEEDVRRLRQEKDIISDERDNKRCQYEIEKEAKDNALKSLENMKQDKRALEEELSFLKQSTSEKRALEEDNKRLSRENDHISRKRDDERKRYKTEKDAKDDALARLEAINRDKCAVEEEIMKIEKQSSTEKAVLEKQMKSLRQENDKINRKRDNDRHQFKAEMKAKECDLQSLRQEKDMITHERDNKRRQYETEIIVKENAIERMRHERDKAIQQCKAARDDAHSRDNNPNITDLSDQNRPTRIAEKMAELFDNQWTDAFDALEQTDKNEKEIINMLLESLMTAYGECFKLANDNFFEKVQRVIECPKLVDRQLPTQVVISDQLKQEIKEFRKNHATKVWKEIEAIVLPKIQLSSYHQQDIDAYLSLCVEISWLMVVQDPPLVLNDKAQDRFDTNTFKDYTKRGPIVEFVVWPALLLHESGPLLAKGVAQGCIGQQISNQNDQANAERKLSTQSMILLYPRDKSDQDQTRRMASTFSATTGTKPPVEVSETFKPPPDGDE